jgi:hypothetical protein
MRDEYYGQKRRQVKGSCLLIIAFFFILSCCAPNSDTFPSDDSLVVRLGFINEYEFNADESFLAVVVPAEAKKPGSPAFVSVARESIVDQWQILVYDAEDASLAHESPLYDANNVVISNLRWLDRETLLFVHRRVNTISLIRWKTNQDEWEHNDFPYSRFDLSHYKSQLIAWHDADIGERERLNELAILELSDLRIKKALTIDEVNLISEAFWAAGDSWIMVSDLRMQNVFKLDPASGETTMLFTVPRGTSNTALDRQDMLLVSRQLNSLTIHDLSRRCDIEKDETAAHQPEWSANQNALFLVLQEFDKEQTLLLNRDMSYFYEPSGQTCINEGDG